MMLSVLSNCSLVQALNQPIHTVDSSSPHLSNTLRKIRNIRNTYTHCVTIDYMEKSYDPISHGRGRKLESLKISLKSNMKSLKKHNISINTEAYNQLGPSGPKEIEKAIDKRYLSFENGSWVGKKDEHVLRFYLPKNKGNFRVELAHRNNLHMNTDSMYEFQMRAGYAAHDVIFFQVKESGGDMKTNGLGRPPVSLHLKNEKEIHVAINSENGSVLREEIAILNCPQEWYKFKVRIVWNRSYPSIQVAVNGKNAFAKNVSFGAHNSISHYSKFGIYVPQQKNEEGVKDTSLLFYNVKENHRYFNPKIRHNKVKNHD